MAQKTRTRQSRGLWIFLVLIFMGSFPFFWQSGLRWWYEDRILSRAEAPQETVAIVFGARVYNNGRLSSMLRDRVETAVQLYHAGQIQQIIMSGDNSSQYYNEPAAMIAYAREMGVPAAALQPDYAGLRTYDTCYRAHELFAVEDALLITQEFHLPRALFTCNNLGIRAVGIIADMRAYSERSLSWSENREIPASLVALYDVLRRQPATITGGMLPLNNPNAN
jgi:SanA protein